MKFATTLAVASMMLSTVSAFSVAPLSSQRLTTRVFSEPADKPDEEGGLDLDLGEMFSMFDAAEKEQDFEDALKKVKGDK